MYKAKSKSLAAITITILTLSMVLAVIPLASAMASTILESGEGGFAEWTTAEKKFGAYSVKLSIPDGATADAYAEVSVPVSVTLGSIDLDNTYFWCKTTVGNWTPYFIFELEDSGRINTDANSSAGYTGWAKYVASASPQFQWGDGTWHNWADTLSHYGSTASVTRIYVELSGLQNTGEADYGPFTSYVDNITVNGVSYELEPVGVAEISPTLVRAKDYWFEVKVTNYVSTPSIHKVVITYPLDARVAYLDTTPPSMWVISEHDTAANKITYIATGGYEIEKGTYKTFRVRLNVTEFSNVQDDGYDLDWSVECTNTAMEKGSMPLKVKVDDDKPTVTITDPNVDYYTASAGNRIWINGTVEDNLNMTIYPLTLDINDTRFELVAQPTGKTFDFAFRNTTAIPDGPLAVNITATDKAGNVKSAEKSTTIDNTAPRIVWVKVLDQDNKELPYVDEVYWMGSGTTSIKVNASFYNPATPLTGKIYLNTTEYAFTNETATPALTVTGSDYVTLKITLVDSASPTPNNFTQTWEIKRDKVKPSTPTFTVQPICGGAIIRALNATDNVGVLSYRVYINGTSVDVPLTDLNKATLTSVGAHRTFAGTLVLALSGYAGKVANITIATVDYGANEGIANTTYSSTSIPEGTWYAIELYKGYNLVSLPLIPNSTARADIYSLILKQGAEGVKITYSFDNQAKTWTMNPATMTDGAGYWINMKAYDVLIVQGTPIEEYWGLEPIHYLLYKGWNLVGYTAIEEGSASDYLGSLDTNSYYRYVYVWNAKDQKWTMVKAVGDNPGKLSPGQGFWILLYSDQTLIPPVPTL
jgi:hypothetical protein